MRRLFGAALACAAMAAAGAVSAQDSAARRAADAVIGRSAVGDLFENVSDGGEPKLRHKASGMTCNLGGDATQWRRDDVSVFPSGLPRGDDVGCNIWFGDVLVSMDVTRFAPLPSLDVATAAYEGSVMRLHPSARPYTGATADTPPTAGLPPVRTVRYVFPDRGGQYSRLSVAIANGWVVEERATGPLNDAVHGDTVSNQALQSALISFTR